MSIRTERVASLLKQEIGVILARECRDAGLGLVTVTDVRMSPDLKIARIAVSVLGSDLERKKAMSHLEEEKHHIRGLVGSDLRLKYTPVLQFYLDETLERVDRINMLIQKIHKTEGEEGDSGG